MTIFKKSISNRKLPDFFSAIVVLVLSVTLLAPATVRAMIIGETGSHFNLTASEGYISIADGGSIYSWGYSNNGTMQLPGPTLIVDQGTTVTITLNNNLPAAAGNTSIVFPGHQVTTSSGVAGQITQEAPVGGSVTYSFVANTPGTYQYHSGTRPDLQIEMGLYGAIIVRPSSPAVGCSVASAYDHPKTCYDREYLYLLSEIDIDIHEAAQQQATGPGPIDVGSGPFHPEYWLLNGRAAPDTMASAGTSLLPNQPYNAMTRMHPGEKILLRVVGAGRDMHPFHTHGNHSQVLARDGRLLLSATDSSQLAGPLLFTIPAAPGGTVDAIFGWTGKDLGWDIYGHKPSDPMEEHEWAPDHGKPIPVELPSLSSMAFGGFYSGSPFLGAMGSLPPGEGGLNPNAGYAYMWHSHTEREMVNNDVFPGGMMTMLIIEAPSVVITE
ncbi:multicopper oxidase domain-containing protein [Thiomicrorhabdus chilensis]|uniref:multicopper oxidase domain-containing protein n=1 Tax=Thiomicrorhabdus chilensis TaxID=63656 RepID=UPI000416851D|nr:multicopper oxidase domain-containing protein [Thiomicrorhabdus chilensis]